ncbi:MAG: DM13 domain-containing protein [Dehalococcoidia bacterium]
MRLKYILIGIAVVVLIPIIGVAWWLLSPLLTDTTVDEEFPFAANAVVPPDMTMAQVNEIMAKEREVNEEVTEAMPPNMAAPATPTLLQKGEFRDADRFHKGSGLAEIFQGPDGSHLLRLENFSVTSGPALHVLLTPHANPESQEDVKTPGWVDLGDLKGNMGNQNYPIPDDVEVGAQGSVVIYCMPFHVIFSVATLADAG